MAYYRVYYHETGGYRAVKKGFSWPASFLGWLWAFVSKLWGQGIIGLIAWMILVSLFDTYKHRDDTGALGIILLLKITCIFIFGAFGNRWRMNSLVRRGFGYVDTLETESAEAAIIHIANKKTDP